MWEIADICVCVRGGVMLFAWIMYLCCYNVNENVANVANVECGKCGKNEMQTATPCFLYICAWFSTFLFFVVVLLSFYPSILLSFYHSILLSFYPVILLSSIGCYGTLSSYLIYIIINKQQYIICVRAHIEHTKI